MAQGEHMATALDSHHRRVSVIQQAPRHREYKPRVVAVVDPADLAPAVELILARLANIQARWGTGAYVFIDATRHAFVLTDDHTCAQRWLREHFGWLVGFYSRVPPLLVPTPDGLAEDVADHLQQLVAAA